MNDKIRVLVIENQPLTRIGIKTVIESSVDFELAGEAGDGAEGFSKFRELRPDVTVLGLRLPDSCAIETLGGYFETDANARILVLADTAGDAEISKALKRGAAGFICKDIDADELLKALKTVAAGRKFIPGDIAEILSENLGSEELTAMETRILGHIVAGKANKEIAYELGISENTVKTHVKNVFEKLAVSDRTTAATVAIKRGLVRFHL